MKRNDFRFLDRLRVRWSEVDPQQIVFNGHYLTYFDSALSAYWRELALPYAVTMQYLDGDLFMRKSTLEYNASAHNDDVLDVGVRCARVGNTSLVMHCAVFRQDQLLVSGELVYVFANSSAQTAGEERRAKPVPQELRDVLTQFEAGKPMVEVRVGAWDALGADAHPIRTSVFVKEQGIPVDREWDNADAGCVHAVAYNRFGVPLATGRMIEHVPGVAKIGRMAVVQTMRGSGVGRAVLDALMDAARARGYREAVLHAQASAAPFYVRAGFATRGPMFEEVGIEHVEMTRVL